MQLPRTAPPTPPAPGDEAVLDWDAPSDEVTENVLWPKGWVAEEVGFALTAGWSGALVRLVHAHVFHLVDGKWRKSLVDLLGDLPDEELDARNLTRVARPDGDDGPAGVLLPEVGANLWFVVPENTRAVTVQYAAPGGLSYLSEFTAKEAS